MKVWLVFYSPTYRMYQHMQGNQECLGQYIDCPDMHNPERVYIFAAFTRSIDAAKYCDRENSK